MSLIKLSPNQIDAARRNGAKSGGPKTPEGKARSAMNALKHGRYAKLACVLRGEDKEAYQSLLHSLVRRFQPLDEVELRLVRLLASTEWRLARIVAADSRILDMEIDVQTPALQNAGGRPSELDCLTFSYQSLVDRSKLPQFLAARESQLIFGRQSILQQLRQLRRDWPLAVPPPQVFDPEPLDPEIAPPNEPATNPPPVASIDGHPPLPSPKIPESEVA